MIKDLDKSKLDDLFGVTSDPNLIFEENDNTDYDSDATHEHHHNNTNSSGGS